MKAVFYGMLVAFIGLAEANNMTAQPVNKPPLSAIQFNPKLSHSSTAFPPLADFEVPTYRQSLRFDQIWAFDKTANQPFNALQTIAGPFGVFMPSIVQRSNESLPVKLTFAVNAYNIPNIYHHSLLAGEMNYTGYFSVNNISANGQAVEFLKQEGNCIDNPCLTSDSPLISSKVSSQIGAQKSTQGFQLFGWDFVFLRQTPLPGTQFTVKGAIHLSIATKTQQISTTVTNNKANFSKFGFKLNLVQIKPGVFEYEATGQYKDILSIRAINPEGKYIDNNGFNINFDQKNATSKGSLRFTQKIESIELVVAQSLECRAFDFEFTVSYQGPYYLQDNAIRQLQAYSTDTLAQDNLGRKCDTPISVHRTNYLEKMDALFENAIRQ